MDIITTILIIAISGPVIGSLIGVIKKPPKRMMYNMLSFAAGVMLAISFLELIPQSILLSSELICMLGILLGAIVMYILDKIIPHIHPELCTQEQGRNLKKTSIYLIFGIFLHNFPEGMAIAVGTISDSTAGIAIALSIAIHNIAEGICTSAPYYACTKNRLKSFLVSASTAIPVVIGFLFATYLYNNITNTIIGFIISATAGIMIYISSDELIPTSNHNSTDHSTIFSLIIGVLFVILLGTI